MMLGFSRPDAGTVEVLGGTPADAVAQGRIAAVLQTGGLLKDLTVAETVRLTAEPVRHRPAGRRGARPGRHRRHRRAPRRRLLRRPAAAAAVRAGPAARPRPARPRRADHRHGRRGPPRVLGRDPRRRRPRPHGDVRARTTSRRPTSTPTGSCWCGAAASSPTGPPPRSRASPPAAPVRATLPDADQVAAALRRPASTSVEVRGDTVLVRDRRLRRVARAPAHPHRRARPRDHRARPRGRLHRPHRRADGTADDDSDRPSLR